MEVLDLIYDKLDKLDKKVDKIANSQVDIKIKVYTIIGIASALNVIFVFLASRAF